MPNKGKRNSIDRRSLLGAGAVALVGAAGGARAQEQKAKGRRA